MDFTGADGQVAPEWREYFKFHGVAESRIPQGRPGLHPLGIVRQADKIIARVIKHKSAAHKLAGNIALFLDRLRARIKTS
jgi:hypothetical protein